MVHFWLSKIQPSQLSAPVSLLADMTYGFTVDYYFENATFTSVVQTLLTC
jgi:hypothetical protein